MKIPHSLCYLLCDNDHLGDNVKFLLSYYIYMMTSAIIIAEIFVIVGAANIDITITSRNHYLLSIWYLVCVESFTNVLIFIFIII